MITIRQPRAYYFYHIPKTAGTTLNAALLDIFTPNQVCPPFLWHQLLKHDRRSLRQFRLFRGHFYAALEPFLGFPVRSFVFLRDPKERALSHYGHIMRAPGHYLHEKALKLQTFEAFLQDPETRETVSNFQSKCLATSFDPNALAAGLSDRELESFELERKIETASSLLTSQQLLQEARSALDRIECVCITEFFSNSILLLGKTFKWDLKQYTNPQNQNPQRIKASDLSSKESTILHELNIVDIHLYSEAKSMFCKSMCALPNVLTK
jgi:hypothetical protein